ncbi:MAG: guanylate kinase [Clostridiales bacterium]|jgi:guanylate kinase|nr:guanylate kinase [Clostridiales bacterium]
MQNSGMLIIISGPSGSGKGTVVKHLGPEKNYALSISVTTRKKRACEEEGKDYFFCTTEEFERMRNNGELLEHAVFCGKYYGTPRVYVEEQVKLGKAVVLEIDVNGALQIKEKFAGAVLIFLMPPTMAELKSRLINRNTENKETIEARLRRANEEVKLIDKYDYLVLNDEVESAAARVDTIVDAERLKPCRNLVIINSFKGDVL